MQGLSAILKHAFKLEIKNIYCTKIASKLVELIRINMATKICAKNYRMKQFQK